MNKTVYVKLKCPKCHHFANAKLDKKAYRVLIYRCPICSSNVVYYENNIDILSDEFMNSIIRSNKLRFCGDAFFHSISPSKSKAKDEYITKDRIIDLKILLNTEKNFNRLLSKL